MNRCATCKHWNQDFSQWAYPEFPSDWGHCGRADGFPSERYDSNPPVPFRAVCDMEGIGGEMVTRADFGCTEWEGGVKGYSP